MWTLWVSAADGKPLELRDPAGTRASPPQVIRRPTYEVLRGSDADRLVTLTGRPPVGRGPAHARPNGQFAPAVVGLRL